MTAILINRGLDSMKKWKNLPREKR
jgi:hypothetical protein